MSAPLTAANAANRSVFVPFLVLAAAFVIWTGFQSANLMREHDGLTTAHQGQTTQLAEAAKLRASLDSVASETRKLADAGNPDAKLIVDELKKRGVTIAATPQAQQPPPQ